ASAGPHEKTQLWFARTTDRRQSAFWRSAYAMVEFLLWAQPENSAVGLQQRLGRGGDFERWLAAALQQEPSTTMVRQLWLQFLSERGLSGQRADEIAPPSEEVVTLCRSTLRQDRLVLVRYQPASGTWSEEVSWDEAEFGYMRPLPSDNGVVIQLQGTTGPQTYLWRAGVLKNLSYETEAGQKLVAFSGLVRPDGEALLMMTTGSPPPTDDQVNYPELYLTDLDTCLAGQCDLARVDGVPSWSPNGQRAIIQLLGRERSEGPPLLKLSDGDGVEERALAPGSSPIWFDNRTYGYVDESGQVISGSMESTHSEVLLSRSDLRRALPDDARFDRPAIVGLNTGESGGVWLVVSVLIRQPQSNEAFVLLYDLERRRIHHVIDMQSHGLTRAGISADERWLIWHQGTPSWNANLNTDYATVVYEIESGRRQSVAIGDPVASYWSELSADSRWLLTADDDLLRLVALGQDVGEGHFFQQVVSLPYDGCIQALWVRPPAGGAIN
ncbi:MAG: hypothetical protein R3300_21065, partial [Candidatus Promineifilaceae bacterium]|nr:hypothetical protein [Candidatus Promineifilaceae bacterium]